MHIFGWYNLQTSLLKIFLFILIIFIMSDDKASKQARNGFIISDWPHIWLKSETSDYSCVSKSLYNQMHQKTATLSNFCLLRYQKCQMHLVTFRKSETFPFSYHFEQVNIDLYYYHTGRGCWKEEGSFSKTTQALVTDFSCYCGLNRNAPARSIEWHCQDV